jgi:hypothetical protein
MSAADQAGDDVVVGEEPEYEEKLDEAPKSILMGMMRQLKVGMDLSRITLPAFILEPRSFLEKCSDFMSHGHHLLRYIFRTSHWSLISWFRCPIKRLNHSSMQAMRHSGSNTADGCHRAMVSELVASQAAGIEVHDIDPALRIY